MPTPSLRLFSSAVLAVLAALAAGALWAPMVLPGAGPVAAVLSVGPGTAQAQTVQGPAQGAYPYQCADNSVFIRCVLQQTGPNQDQDELWECASGGLHFDQDADGQENVAFDGTCAVEVHNPGDPAWVWAGGFADHVLVCPAGELWRTDSGQQWETGPDCVEAPTPSLDALAPSGTWDTTDPIGWQDAQQAPASCGWTLSC